MPQSLVMQMGSERNDTIPQECSSNVSVPKSDLNKSSGLPKAADFAKFSDPLKCADITKGIPVGTLKSSPQAAIYWSKGRCTVQFERRFIEVDDELVSVITDIEGIMLCL